ncbi:Holliday junction resolvase RuvX [bacterium]|nr:Holliday junction resolvase RuvX [bacterium]
MAMKMLGLDIGDKKIGVAICGSGLAIAIPKGVIDSGGRDDKLHAIANLIESEDIELVVVGLPLNMKGEIAHQAKKVQGFIRHLKKVISIPVEMIDERLTSKIAGGGDDDAQAAALILQTYIDKTNFGMGEEK